MKAFKNRFNYIEDNNKYDPEKTDRILNQFNELAPP